MKDPAVLFYFQDFLVGTEFMCDEDLIKTFSNEGDLVVDLTMGSGSTGVACKNTNRNFIGIEKDENYFKIAEQRINARTLFS